MSVDEGDGRAGTQTKINKLTVIISPRERFSFCLLQISIFNYAISFSSHLLPSPFFASFAVPIWV